MHSNASADGELTVDQLLDMAESKDIEVLALCDHNTNKNLDEFVEKGGKRGLKAIPSIENDTRFKGYQLHVIGYNIDYHRNYFEALPDNTKKLEDIGSSKLMQSVSDYFSIKLDDSTRKKIMQSNNWLKSLIDLIMAEPKLMNDQRLADFRDGGPKSDPIIPQFYWHFCDKNAPCHVEIEYPYIDEVIKEIHVAGGIAVLAHPWNNFYNNEKFLKEVIDQGLDGIEAYSTYHNDEQNHYYEDYCLKNNIMFTCGSDFHGRFKPNIKMGEHGYQGNDDVIKRFIDRIK